jgi:UDP-N-acetyl-D-galactosamine dehydrogenase
MKKKIAVIGLGYVGLPLAIALAKKFNVVGYDKNKDRINKLNQGIDENGEAKKKDLKNKNLFFTSRENLISEQNFFIICVPTPIKNKKPDLTLLIEATKLVANKLKLFDTIVFESTVYPGTTEEICCPIIEKISKLKVNKNFYLGYSPERINPGLNTKKISTIKKIISGSSKKALFEIRKIYKPIISAGLFSAKSIKVAESAKIIENTQRDINIALMNEFSKILNKLNINTNDVLSAAKTKWNFNDYTPGLVGGHCIGIDPYYLAYKAKKIGINPKIILSGRSVNDGMHNYIFKKINEFKNIKKIAYLGITFKENCMDFRNSMPIKLLKKLKQNKFEIDVFDPIVNKKDLENFEQISITKKMKKQYYDLVLIVVPHKKNR